MRVYDSTRVQFRSHDGDVHAAHPSKAWRPACNSQVTLSLLPDRTRKHAQDVTCNECIVAGVLLP